MVNFEVMVIAISWACGLALLAAIVPYKVKIPEKKRVLFKAKKPKKIF
jgi:hypothetical protein